MNIYKRHRFPPDIEDLLAERGITVSYETIRLWCIQFGAKYVRQLKRKHRGYGDTFYVDEVFVKINGKQHYLWRAVDQDGEVVDVYLQARCDGAAAKRFFKPVTQAQRFVTAHAAVSNLFNLGRHLVSAQHYRDLRAVRSVRSVSGVGQ